MDNRKDIRIFARRMPTQFRIAAGKQRGFTRQCLRKSRIYLQMEDLKE
jgi:hypothetical protein